MRSNVLLTAVAMLLTQTGCATTMSTQAWTPEQRQEIALSLGRPLVPDPLPEGYGSDYALGLRHGEMAATWHDTSGRMTGGFLAGLTLGLIGTGIAYVVADSDDVRTPASQFVPPVVFTEQNEYTAGFRRSYTDRVRDARKSRALRGGLMGTFVTVSAAIVYIMATN